MNNSTDNTNSGWTPPPRPEWVDTLNKVGGNFGPNGPETVVPLDEKSLLDAATTATGLTDFGDEAWREPFGILLRDLEQAELTLTGRLLARIDILQSLVARLRMAETERQHPEILDQEIENPIFITGLGRTGTTILLELLGQDPNLRPALGWELRYPSPPPEAGKRENDPRIASTAADVELWLQVVPEFRAIHEIVVNEPEADSVGMVHEFASPIWTATHHLPNYEAWMREDRLRQPLRFHRRLLKHLQWKNPGRWVLKFPSYLSNLPSLFEEFPDAKVIITHRDPVKVMSSSANMQATLRWQRSDQVNYEGMAAIIVQGFPMLLEMVTQQRETGVVPNDQIVDMRYADLMRDLQATVREIYNQLGIELTDEAAKRMEAYLDARPRGRHGVHAYRFEDLGVDYQEMREKFSEYMNRYDIPEEKL
jgi:sulfotransferase family protein